MRMGAVPDRLTHLVRGIDVSGAIFHERIEIVSDIVPSPRDENISVVLAQGFSAVKLVEILQRVRRRFVQPIQCRSSPPFTFLLEVRKAVLESR